jgi:hypothetical protein
MGAEARDPRAPCFVLVGASCKCLRSDMQLSSSHRTHLLHQSLDQVLDCLAHPLPHRWLHQHLLAHGFRGLLHHEPCSLHAMPQMPPPSKA